MSSLRTSVYQFNNNETVRFLELYEMERGLYDSTEDDYRDRHFREAAARRISRALNMPDFGPKEVITKFKNLRSSYCQELKKIAVSERSDTGRIYKSKVFWFDQMNAFIRPFVQQRPIQSNLVLPSENNQKQPKLEIEVAEDHCYTNKHSKGSLPDIPKIVLERKMSSVQSHPSTLKHTKTTHDNEINVMPCTMDKLQEILRCASHVTAVNKDDSYDHFGKYVASMLRSIGSPIAMKLQLQITSMITNAMCPPENVSDSG